MDTTAVDAPAAVRLQGITKRYPGVVANDGIDVVIRSGTVHALCGENGAGKSTLMKILYGLQQPDAGSIEIDGVVRLLSSPAAAIAVGIGMVHQHFMLADNLTVWENIVLGAEPSRGPRLDASAARASIMEIAARHGLAVDPDVLVEDLGVGVRQRVEILKALYRGARILILDEPTTVLVPHEVDELFRNLAEMKAEGLTIIFISHKLDEVRHIADEITVLRHGRTVGTADPKTVTNRELAELMVGATLPPAGSREDLVREEVVLQLSGVGAEDGRGRPTLNDVSLIVRAGEVLGIGGVEGNGQAELVDAIMGILPTSAGEIRLRGVDISASATRARRRAGISLVPEDRHRQGMLLEASLWENRFLGTTAKRWIRGKFFLRRSALRDDTARIVRDFDVRTPGIDVIAAALSGGNQQKLVLGRELSDDPVLLIAAHPTRGVDVAAQAAIWDHIHRARRRGLAVLLISADLDELIGMSDSLAVILRGRIVGHLDPRTITPEALGMAMTGADRAPGASTDEREHGDA